MLLTDQMTYLPNDLLVKVDIATMAVSLEARSPFLDHHVIEFAASLPQNLKLRRLTSKYLLKKVLRKLLPSENLNRRKMGFGVSIGHWFRGKMQPFLREVVLSDKALRRGLFKPEAVRQLIELHTRGERDYSHQLWTLLMLELWFNVLLIQVTMQAPKKVEGFAGQRILAMDPRPEKKPRACAACGSTDAQSLGVKNELEIVACRKCSTVYTPYSPWYSSEYYYDSYYRKRVCLPPAFIQTRFEEITAEFAPYRQTNRLLDMGCGAGNLLLAARKNGWNAHGLDVDQTQSSMCASWV